MRTGCDPGRAVAGVRAREAQMSCIWEEYQADQTFPKMTRWLKHRAYIRIMLQCRGDRREAQCL